MASVANWRNAVLALLLTLHGVQLGRLTRPGDTEQQWTATEDGGRWLAASGRVGESSNRLSAMPLRFEANIGQADPRVDSVARGHGYTLYLQAGNAVFEVGPASRHEPRRRAFALTLAGGHAGPEATHFDPQPGITNYLIGSDRSKWRTGVRSWARVKYSQVYPGVDLVYYANPHHLEHDFIVAPGADPSVIALRFEGIDQMRLDTNGDLVLSVAGFDVHQKAPTIYQDTSVGERHFVDGRYVVHESTVRFEVGEYDAGLPLVIDPVTLIYSTFLGGTSEELAVDVASDASGSAYVLGLSTSLEYPTINALQASHAGGTQAPFPGEPAWIANNIDLVLSKLTPDGQALEYSTYLGGPGNDRGFALAVNATGEVFITGALPGGLPAVSGYEHNCPCEEGFYVAKLNASATEFLYVARFAAQHFGAGGTADVGVDGGGNAVVVGGGMTFKLNAGGSALVYATEGDGVAVAVGEDGSVAMTGFTNSISFPTVAPFQEALHGKFDAFVRGLRPDGTVQFATYLGGLGDDGGTAVAIDGAGAIHVTGTTASRDFPIYRAAPGTPGGTGTADMFVTKISQAGALLYSTYLGGGYADMGVGIVLDSLGRPYVVGRTFYSTGSEWQPASYPQNWDSNWDVSVTKLDTSGAPLDSTVFGGPFNDQPAAIALGPDGSVYIAGTSYGGIPLKNPLRRLTPSVITHHGEPHAVDLFVARLAMPMAVSSVNPSVLAEGRPARIVITGGSFQLGTRVLIRGEWATGVVVQSSTSLSAMVPALAPGLYDIVVISPDGETASLADALMYGTCSFVVPDAPQVFLGSGGSRTVSVTAVADRCGWTASSNAEWITVAPSGSGSGAVRFTVAPNGTSLVRSGMLTIAGQPILVTQARSTEPDMNGDGRIDLLWQHETEGWLSTWLMDEFLQRISGVLLSPPQVAETNWKVVGTGDFNGDGRSDLVWQHAGDGRLAAWLMNGLASMAGVPLSPPQVADLDWRIGAVGDLNTDGHPDLIWHHRTDGRIAVWFMEGLRLIEGRLLFPPAVIDTDWWIVGGGDFSHDGRLDLVWEHQTDGRIAVWEMNGPILVSGQVHGRIDSGPATDVKIRAVGDFDHDGHLDLMGQHVGGRDLRFCKNTPVGSDNFVFTCNLTPTPDSVPDTNWRIVGPR